MSLHKAAHAGLWKGDEMKWLLRGIFLIFLIFAGLITAGYFMPSIQLIERSIEIEAYPEDVFPFINDLQSYSQWSPLYEQISDAQIVYGGAEAGNGQTSLAGQLRHLSVWVARNHSKSSWRICTSET